MFNRLLRFSTTILAFSILALLIASQSANLSPVAAYSPAEARSSPLELLARARGYAPQALDLTNVETLTMADGRQITLVKALDRITHQTVSAAFDGEREVDARAEQMVALEAWRRAHGALASELVNKLERSPAGEKFTVAVWLKAQIEALPRPDFGQRAANPASSTASEDLPAQAAATRPGIEKKSPSIPLASADVPPDVVARALGSSAAQPAADDSRAQEQEKTASQAEPQTDTALLQQIESFKQLNEAHLRAQVAPLRAGFLDYAAAHNLQVQYASEIAPVIFLTGLSRAQLEDLARQPEIDKIYDASLPGGPLLDIARPTQNADLLETWGNYTGSGINVGIVEGERASNVNPYLNIVQTRDTGRSIKSHPTAVSGMVASFHSTIRGIANAANLYSANGDDYTTIAALEAAMDWATSRVSIMNNSFWAAECGLNDVIQTIDRHMDYLVRYNYDLAVVAAGNFAVVSCDGTNPAPYVSSPSKGYNALTVGNYQDHNTLDWSDDDMRPSSSYNTSGRWKPEVAASGSDINSTITSSPWTGPTGSGTSYSSPMVSGLAANIQQAAPGLSNEPEAVTAIIMATAMHNIEGSSVISRQDGTGGIDASAALVSVERGNYDDVYIESTTTFPLEYTQFAYKGETVRFAIRWLSNPTSDYTSDVLPVDLDLKAYRSDGTTLITSSSNGITNIEIVQFVAPASETYRFRIERYGSWTGGATWLGVGWWRGTYRISPDVGYGDPQASPMGTHLSVFPTDWSPTNYWRVLGIRPVDSDHDLRLFSRSFFDNPGLRSQLESSSAGGSYVDFIAVDGNHWPSGDQEQYFISLWTGTGGYRVSWSNLGEYLYTYGWYGPYSMTSAQVVKVFDVWFGANQQKQIQIVPTGSNATNLGVVLFQSDGASSPTWHKNRFEYSAISDKSTAPSYTENFMYKNTSGSSDYLGLVVYSNDYAYGQFYILISQPVYTPLIRH
jgi:hypothetical protein